MQKDLYKQPKEEKELPVLDETITQDEEVHTFNPVLYQSLDNQKESIQLLEDSQNENDISDEG